MTHKRAVALMVFVALLWSMAGVITRHLDSARSFEVNFWRSFFNVLALAIAFSAMHGRSIWRGLASARWPIWVSGFCWSLMFTAFMVAITLTTVANVLVALAAGPLVTALFSRLFLGHRLPGRTWLAIAIACSGIAWMFGKEALAGASPTGTLVALIVPVAAASNWTLMQFVASCSVGRTGNTGETVVPTNMLPAILIGGLISALATLPLAYPFQATPHDLRLLAVLGVFQLALPCLLVVRLSRELPAAEIALLALLEVIFGVIWAWLGAGERPAQATLVGGLLVIGALLLNELVALRKRRNPALPI
jgi:drug/metabolite transporter (DMT)-like permease